MNKLNFDSIRIVVASGNPVKIEAARNGVRMLFPEADLQIWGAGVDSGVPAQPMGHEQTFQGALNRARAAMQATPAGFAIGIEGGLEKVDGRYHAFAWVAVVCADAPDVVGRGQTGVFVLPQEVGALVDQGMELGDADDAVFKRKDSKRENGAVGILTGDVLTRESYYRPAVVLAFIPFINPKLHW
jgi:inosine/xanthosine triphosphatase